MGRRLVRDRAMDAWVVPGAEEQVRPIRGRREHLELLRAKILEEAAELAMVADDSVSEKPFIDGVRAEAVDVLEAVFSYVQRATHITPSELLEAWSDKRAENGGFLEGLVWDTTR